MALMDVNCPRCGEPFDPYEFHYYEDGYDAARKIYFEQGCGMLLDGTPCPQTGDIRALYAEAAYEVNGDDVDGIASDLNMF
jgi:hypothetical protein